MKFYILPTGLRPLHGVYVYCLKSGYETQKGGLEVLLLFLASIRSKELRSSKLLICWIADLSAGDFRNTLPAVPWLTTFVRGDEIPISGLCSCVGGRCLLPCIWSSNCKPKWNSTSQFVSPSRTPILLLRYTMHSKVCYSTILQVKGFRNVTDAKFPLAVVEEISFVPQTPLILSH